MEDCEAKAACGEKYMMLLEATCTVISDYDVINDVMTTSAPRASGMADTVVCGYRRSYDAESGCSGSGDVFYRSIAPALEKPKRGSFVYSADHGRGKRWYRASYISMPDESGSVCRLLCMSVDITDEYNERQRLRELAHTDNATGLANKAAAQLEIRQNLLHLRRDGEDALLMVDIDDFKKVNDSAGHSEGDRVILEFASLLRSTFRSTDVISRFGGDEFMVYLRGGSPRLARSKVAAILRGAAHITFCEKEHIGCSIGIVNIPGSETSFERIFNQADYALYTAKRNGKNTCSVFDPGSMSGNMRDMCCGQAYAIQKKQL